jgi:hypothetical protein
VKLNGDGESMRKRYVRVGSSGTFGVNVVNAIGSPGGWPTPDPVKSDEPTTRIVDGSNSYSWAVKGCPGVPPMAPASRKLWRTTSVAFGATKLWPNANELTAIVVVASTGSVVTVVCAPPAAAVVPTQRGRASANLATRGLRRM